jgi:hypothetical protein
VKYYLSPISCKEEVIELFLLDFNQLFMKFQRNIILSDEEWAPKEKK